MTDSATTLSCRDGQDLQSPPRKRRNHDLTDCTFGLLTALRCVGKKNTSYIWLCRCVCGLEREFRREALTRTTRAQTWCGDLDRHLFDDVEKQPGPDGCWIIKSRPNGNGYHRIGKEFAHRRVYRVCVGEIPEGYDVMHKCDCPACIRPEHLALGTRSDNMLDAAIKGRNASTKLTPDIVQEIRRLHATDEWTLAALARKYSVSVGCISAIVERRTWDWLPEPDAPPADHPEEFVQRELFA